MKIFKNMMILVALIVSVNIYAYEETRIYAYRSNTFAKGDRKEFLSAIERIKAKKRVDDDDMVILIKHFINRDSNREIKHGMEELKKILPDIEDQVSQAEEAKLKEIKKREDDESIKNIYDETTQTLKKDGVRRLVKYHQRMLQTTYLRPNEIARKIYEYLAADLQGARGESRLKKNLADELWLLIADVVLAKSNTPKQSGSQYKKPRR